ncbi:hypothetical protein F2P56_008969 [Juglans regia]|uniref:Peptidase C1A papain C-terminal domain-containing protein n=1 Tax=Juglans regia TaxID=51240 RepID=A0A833XMP7_JUGRE|nr:hypothetical protein F2P56_008969 [Juglans regia]
MCWVIVAAEAVAAGHKAKNPDKDLLELSSQELLDCCKEEEKQCYTYSIIKALKWIKSYGIMKEEEYPFKAHKCPCRHKTEKQKTLAVKIVDIQKVDHDNENELLMRVKEQPIACGLIVTKAFQELEGGIYEGSDELDLILQGKEKAYRHAILIIGFGYDEKEDKKYWIIKNSMAKIGECTDMPELLRLESVTFLVANSKTLDFKYFLDRSLC